MAKLDALSLLPDYRQAGLIPSVTEDSSELQFWKLELSTERFHLLAGDSDP